VERSWAAGLHSGHGLESRVLLSLDQAYAPRLLGPQLPALDSLRLRAVSSAISRHPVFYCYSRETFLSLTGEKTKEAFSLTFSLLHLLSLPAWLHVSLGLWGGPICSLQNRNYNVSGDLLVEFLHFS
jgi:hypothetical protein